MVFFSPKFKQLTYMRMYHYMEAPLDLVKYQIIQDNTGPRLKFWAACSQIWSVGLIDKYVHVYN